jgi:hypothetical protein
MLLPPVDVLPGSGFKSFEQQHGCQSVAADPEYLSGRSKIIAGVPILPVALSGPAAMVRNLPEFIDYHVKPGSTG